MLVEIRSIEYKYLDFNFNFLLQPLQMERELIYHTSYGVLRSLVYIPK